MNRKVVITESQYEMLMGRVDNSVPESVLSDMKDGLFALPMDEKVVSRLLSTGYKMSVSEFSDDITSVRPDKIVNKFNRILAKTIEKERNIREELEKICCESVMTMFGIGSDVIKFDVHLVDEIDPNQDLHVFPDNGTDYEYDSVDEFDNEDSEILKRCIINTFIAGICDYSICEYGKEWLSDVFRLDSELPNLYMKILKLNNYLMFVANAEIEEGNNKQGGYVNLNVSRDSGDITLEAKAVTFPMLLSEVIKGVMECVSLNGLPEDIKFADNVLNYADALMHDPWYMRMGPALWKSALNIYGTINAKFIPQLLDILSTSPSEDLAMLFKELAYSTKKGHDIMGKIIDAVSYSYSYDEFLGRMDGKRQVLN